jgi:hypothetical protein
MFDKDDVLELNEVASRLTPIIGNVKNKGWHNYDAVQKLSWDGDLLTEVDWLYHWSQTPEDNQIINEKILPVLSNICDTVFDGEDWGWQLTNRYVMTNYKHEL